MVCDQNSSVGLCMHGYKSLCVVVMIYATLVNTQTHRQTVFDQLHYITLELFTTRLLNHYIYMCVQN